MIDGPTPLYVITKPRPGSGGTLLAQALFIPAMGKVPVTQTMPDTESEVQRRLTSVLMTSPAVIIFDNIPEGLHIGLRSLGKCLDFDRVAGPPVGTHSAPHLPITNTVGVNRQRRKDERRDRP